MGWNLTWWWGRGDLFFLKQLFRSGFLAILFLGVTDFFYLSYINSINAE